jgi:hypothetical protein
MGGGAAALMRPIAHADSERRLSATALAFACARLLLHASLTSAIATVITAAIAAAAIATAAGRQAAPRQAHGSEEESGACLSGAMDWRPRFPAPPPARLSARGPAAAAAPPRRAAVHAPAVSAATVATPVVATTVVPVAVAAAACDVSPGGQVGAPVSKAGPTARGGRGQVGARPRHHRGTLPCRAARDADKGALTIAAAAAVAVIATASAATVGAVAAAAAAAIGGAPVPAALLCKAPARGGRCGMPSRLLVFKAHGTAHPAARPALRDTSPPSGQASVAVHKSAQEAGSC